MIQFEPLISWTWAWLFALAITLILAFQLLWIFKTELSSSRKAIKTALNSLFAFIIISYVFQPNWYSDKSEAAVLVHSSVYSKDEIQFWKDSLKVKTAYELSKFQGDGNPVFLLGSDFSQTELLKFGKKEIHWIHDFELGSISFLEWKGIVHEGESQAVHGKIEAQDSLKISISQQGEILSETYSELNLGTFSVEFPAKVLGRNELELLVNDSVIGSVNFFVNEAKPIQYSLKFGFPDAEIRVLTQYLINAGEQVNQQIGISKNAVIRSGNTASDSLEFLIIDPAQLAKESTQKAIDKGASVLVINVKDVAKEVTAVNKAFGTNFSVKRISSEESREVAADLDALPYEFETAIAQKLLFENAVAVQNIGNSKIGLSLLGNTFPIRLAGDSLRYQVIWNEILSAMIPQESGAIGINQPVFKGMQTGIVVNQAVFEKEFISIDSDSVFLQQSLSNPFSKIADFVSLDSGWVSLGDSLEFYSYTAEAWPSLRAEKLRADFLRSYANKEISSLDSIEEGRISDWVWLGIFMLILGMIWLEPKVLD